MLLKNKLFTSAFRNIFALIFLCFSIAGAAQKKNSDFWEHVQFGGGFGLSVGNDYTDISLAPSAIYNFNQYFAAGVGLQGSFIKVKTREPYLEGYKSYLYGGSLIGLITPIEEIQISAELEQLRVNQEFNVIDYSRNFWNTALNIGLGYHSDNVTVGVRYNVLYSEDDLVYSDAFMPFVRIYF
ncbi:hypothetical protein [Flavobacterium lotistagni]|uniref:hypothetical protein n=1 Tax=Flavobacterium lotistagni TaxID=2709660 RepID=UPI001F35F0A8|nr:hypothetical protein [Flavobacterium lotistagni]